MSSPLSDIQRELFLSISGKPYDGNALKGRFSTSAPYNNQKYKYSPWLFTYVIEPDTGYLICELVHRMTNNRIYGWDRKGNELSWEIRERYFKPHM